MDKNTKKILKFFNSHPKDHYSIGEVARCFPKLSTNDLREILEFLRSNSYLRIIQGNLYQATNKSKTYFFTENDKWLSANIIAILALFVSLFAFIRTL